MIGTAHSCIHMQHPSCRLWVGEDTGRQFQSRCAADHARSSAHERRLFSLLMGTGLKLFATTSSSCGMCCTDN